MRPDVSITPTREIVASVLDTLYRVRTAEEPSVDLLDELASRAEELVADAATRDHGSAEMLDEYWERLDEDYYATYEEEPQ
jgi:hypothetical protein